MRILPGSQVAGSCPSVMYIGLYMVVHNNMAANFCQQLRQILTEFDKFYDSVTGNKCLTKPYLLF